MENRRAGTSWRLNQRQTVIQTRRLAVGHKPAGAMMKIFLTALLLIATTTFGVESIPARWHHGLSSTYLTEYAKGEHLVISDIWTGTLGSDAVVKHSLEVKIAAWDQP